MNFANVTAVLEGKFDYTYVTPDRETATETITCKFRRMQFGAMKNGDFMAAVRNEDSDAIAETLGSVIAEWDIDLNGEPFPPTVENLKAAPPDFIMQLTTCYFEVFEVNPQKAEPSPNGSAPRERSEAETLQ